MYDLGWLWMAWMFIIRNSIGCGQCMRPKMLSYIFSFAFTLLLPNWAVDIDQNLQRHRAVSLRQHGFLVSTRIWHPKRIDSSREPTHWWVLSFTSPCHLFSSTALLSLQSPLSSTYLATESHPIHTSHLTLSLFTLFSRPFSVRTPTDRQHIFSPANTGLLICGRLAPLSVRPLSPLISR